MNEKLTQDYDGLGFALVSRILFRVTIDILMNFIENLRSILLGVRVTTHSKVLLSRL